MQKEKVITEQHMLEKDGSPTNIKRPAKPHIKKNK